jgi:hypothetical protein
MWRTMATRGFRQVRVSVRITTLRHVFLVYYDLLGGDPLYPSFYIPRGVVFTRKDQVSYSCIRSGLYLYLSIYKIYLMIIFKPPRLWASWHGSLGRVGRLMVPPPPFLLFESIRCIIKGTKPHQSESWNIGPSTSTDLYSFKVSVQKYW